MNEVLTGIINDYGYLGIFVLILLENVFPPIPSEVVLLFGGFLTIYSNLNIIMVIVAATFGSFIGACVLYFLGELLKKEKLYKLANGKVGKLLCIKTEHIDKAENWFNNKGYKTVFFCRFVPIVRSLISIPAGMAKMSFVKFSALTILGSALWNVVIVYIGHFGGTAWESNLKYFGIYTKISVVVIGCLLLGAIAIYFKKREKRK